MKEKKIWRKILACLLLISMAFSNFSDAADASMNHIAEQEMQDAQISDTDKTANEVQTPETSAADTEAANAGTPGTEMPESGAAAEEVQEPEADTQAQAGDETKAVQDTAALNPGADEMPEAKSDEASGTEEQDIQETENGSEVLEEPEGENKTEEKPDAEDVGEAEKTDGADFEEEPDITYIELDFDGNMTLEELTALPENKVGSTIWKEAAATFMATAAAQSFSARGISLRPKWNCDVYYVNVDENSRYYVEKTDDFSVKYQVRFQANQDFDVAQVRIRVKKELLLDRAGNPVSPSQIALPREDQVDEEHPDLKRPFCYREVSEGDTVYLEFYNYIAIESGLNAAWQVLYKDLNMMEIPDQTEWDLNPRVAVDTWPRGEGAPAWQPDFALVNEKSLKGKTNSEVNISSVTKKAYKISNDKIYTPILYTADQVRQFIDLPEDSKYLIPSGNDPAKKVLDTEHWRFAVWEVTVRGTATQPWALRMDETPDGGELVGYKEYHPISIPAEIYVPVVGAEPDGYITEESRKRTWAANFRVVTAYPADKFPDSSKLNNLIEITAVPVLDETRGEPSVKTASAVCNYKDFFWTYPGGIIGVGKEGIGQKVQSGWLDVYRNLTKDGRTDDYGELSFVSHGSFRDFGYTHVTAGALQGEYIPGHRSKLITADDFVYARNMGADNNMQVLDGNDYYFGSITVTQRDYGYDLWEEKLTMPEMRTDADGVPIDTGLDIFVIPEGETEWKNIRDLDAGEEGLAWKADGMRYAFSPEFLAKYKPWRVKAEHTTTNYSTECYIEVTVCIKGSSERIHQMIEDQEQIEIENLCGVIAERSVDGINWFNAGKTDSDSDSDFATVDGQKANYMEPGLKEATIALYPEQKLEQFKDLDGSVFSVYRYNAWKTLSTLQKHAEADKKIVDASNDVIHRRGKVVYALTAQEGYDVFSQSALAELKRIEGLPKPTRNTMVFYDLLPYGMNLDPSYPVKAGRITEADRQGSYKKTPGLWSSNQVDVTWDTKENYNGTGRTLVIFNLTYTGADASVYTGRMIDTTWTNCYWMAGWGVSFGTYYNWKDADLVEKSENISAFMADGGEELLGGEKDTGLAADGDYETIEDRYKAFKPNDGTNGIDGIKDDPDKKNIIYAYNNEVNQIVQYFESSIVKLVRAEYGKYAPFGESATVEENGYYDYDITVSAGSDGLKDIVVFDQLETAYEDDHFTVEMPQNGRTWRGTLDSVITAGLETMGVKPVIYYNERENAKKPDFGNGEEFNQADGWYTQAQYEQSHTDLSQVKAIAADLRRGTEGNEVVLDAGQMLTFRIRMKAPELNAITSGERSEGKQDAYAYNGISYYTAFDSAEQKENGWMYGNFTTVSLEKAKDLVVRKRLNPDTFAPDSAKNKLFEFTVYDSGMDKALSYQLYTLQKMKDGEWETQTDQTYATDGNGRFSLCADERAIFKKVPGAQNMIVSESDDIFWRWGVVYEDKGKEESGIELDGEKREAHIATVTNTYRPVLYVQKILSNVPQGFEEWAAEQEFTFHIQMKNNGEGAAEAEYTAPKGETLTYYYVDRVQVNGNTPNILEGANGEQYKTGTIEVKKGEDFGTFTLKGGDIIAIFPESTQTGYRVSEILPDGGESDWICTADTMEGEEIPIRGASAVIQNHYRWKDLYLAKNIKDQDPAECTQEFTFKIGKVKKDGTTEWFKQEDLMAEDAAGSRQPILSVLKAEGGYYYGTDIPVVVNEDGSFTAACAGYVIYIPNLSANETYRIVETESGEDYVPEQESVDAWMPLYSSSRQAEITNLYQRRTLEVSKEVVSQSSNAGAEDMFTMQVAVKDEKGSPVSGPFGYYLIQNGQYVDVDGGVGSEPNGDGYRHSTDGDGTFSLKRDQTAVFKDIAKVGWTYTVDETDCPRTYKKLLPADGETLAGQFSQNALKEEETVINASERDGVNLYIKKIYEADPVDEAAKQYVETLKGWDTESPSGRPEDPSVDISLEIDGTPFEGPAQVTVWNQLSGEFSLETWEGDSFSLAPWNLLIIPASALGGTENTAYKLTESEHDRQRLDVRGNICYDISQKKNADGSTEITGIVQKQPAPTITNTVKSYQVSNAAKKFMAANALEVPAEAKLVWCVERWDGNEWQPAAGIPYVVYEGAWTKHDPQAELLTDRILTTGADGCITLTKSGSQAAGYDKLPAVVFIKENQNTVIPKLNYYQGMEKNDLRLVEVMDQSNANWGILEGYMANGAQGVTADAITLERVQNGTCAENEFVNDTNIGFVNSNQKTSVEIAKEMEDADQKLFTMLLKQVVSVREHGDREIAESDIVASEARKDIEYEVYVYDKEQKREVFQRKGSTGINGEIYLKAGEYARLKLQEGTLWTVCEDTQDRTYTLKDLTGHEDSPERLKLLNENLMLINQGGGSGSRQECSVTLYNEDGSRVLYQGTADYGTPFESFIGGVYGSSAWAGEQPAGWSFWPSTSEALYESTSIAAIRGDIELYAVWQTCTITYLGRKGNIYHKEVVRKGTQARVKNCDETWANGVFQGWSIGGGAAVWNPDDMFAVNDDITFESVWERTKEVQIQYHVYWGDGSSETMYHLIDGYKTWISTDYTEITLKDVMYKEDVPVSIDAWSTEPDGAGIRYEAGEKLSLTEIDGEVLNLYAVFDQYKVCYLGRKGELLLTQSVEKGSIARIQPCTEQWGKGTFVKWKNPSSGIEYQPGAGIQVEQNVMILESVWQQTQAITICYYMLKSNSEQEYENVGSSNLRPGTEKTTLRNMQDGVKLTGYWCTEKNGEGIRYEPGAVIPVTALDDMDLYYFEESN